MGRKKDFAVTAIVDTREQLPLDLMSHGLKIERGKLDYGDYSLLVPDLRKVVAIERKTLSDFLACCGRERERFEREIIALRGFRYKAIVLECTLSDIAKGNYRSQIRPESVQASISRWMLAGIPFIFAENAELASFQVARMLQLIAKDVTTFAKTSLKGAVL